MTNPTRIVSAPYRLASALTWLGALGVGCAMLTSCGDETGTQPADPVPHSITLSQANLTFEALGDTTTVTAAVYDQNGSLYQGSVVWSTSNPTVATVTAGLVTAVGNGEAQVLATIGNVTSGLSVTVAQTPTDLSVTPDDVAVSVGGEVHLTVLAVDGNGNPANVDVAWSSSNNLAASVATDGTVSGVAPGRATIKAEAEGHTASALITVLEEGQVRGRIDVFANQGESTPPLTVVDLAAGPIGSDDEFVVPAGDRPWSVALVTDSISGEPLFGLTIPRDSADIRVDADLLAISAIRLSPLLADASVEQGNAVVEAARNHSGYAAVLSAIEEAIGRGGGILADEETDDAVFELLRQVLSSSQTNSGAAVAPNPRPRSPRIEKEAGEYVVRSDNPIYYKLEITDPLTETSEEMLVNPAEYSWRWSWPLYDTETTTTVYGDLEPGPYDATISKHVVFNSLIVLFDILDLWAGGVVESLRSEYGTNLPLGVWSELNSCKGKAGLQLATTGITAALGMGVPEDPNEDELTDAAASITEALILTVDLLDECSISIGAYLYKEGLSKNASGFFKKVMKSHLGIIFKFDDAYRFGQKVAAFLIDPMATPLLEHHWSLDYAVVEYSDGTHAASPEGGLALLSTPEDANFEFTSPSKGTLSFKAPTFLAPMPEETIDYTASLEGYNTVSGTVEVKNGKWSIVEVVLAMEGDPELGSAIAGGFRHTCSVAVDGRGFCWGQGEYGQLGNGSTLEYTTPVEIAGDLRWASLAAGGGLNTGSHSCGITTAGEGYCWGDGRAGQLGNGTTQSRTTPEEISGEHQWASLVSGSAHTCGVTTAGEGYCWGNGQRGQLGNGSTNDQNRPVKVSGDHTWASLVAGAFHTCGVTTDGEGYCWGKGQIGPLGNGITQDQATPVEVQGNRQWARITAGAASEHTCGTTTGGTDYCWGYGRYGQLGNGSSQYQQNLPVEVSGSHQWAMISVGGTHTCGVTQNGVGYCWGSGPHGELGNGTTQSRSTPVAILGNHEWARIVSGTDHTCGATTTGDLYCWGYGVDGQLGNGSTQDQTTPVEVSIPASPGG